MKEPPIDNESQPLEGAYRIAKLIAGYIQGKLSPKEHDELDEWVAASDENMKLFEELTDEANVQKTLEWWRRTDSEAALKKIKEQIGLKPKNHFGPKKILLYAAMVVVIAGALFFLYDNDKDRTDGVATTKEISPGNNRAVLTLADGRRVELDSSGSRVIGEELGVAVRQEGGVVKYGSGQLAVGGGQAKEKGEMVYNTLNVPRGGQYKIILSDGTAVWLNSESSLKFPVVFDMYREVELEGEGYFEVSKALTPGASTSSGLRPASPNGEGQGKTSPPAPLQGERGDGRQAVSKRFFSVNINGARVEVLGTHFNVKSYGDGESSVVLVEGKVRVVSGEGGEGSRQSGVGNRESGVGSRESGEGSRESGEGSRQEAVGSRELRPGEMAVIGKDGKVSVSKADVDEAVAWKEGRFYFKDATIGTIMLELERWYDIEVAYEDAIYYHFNAPDIPRGLPLSKVLKVLEMTNKVRFEVEGRKVRVRGRE